MATSLPAGASRAPSCPSNIHLAGPGRKRFLGSVPGLHSEAFWVTTFVLMLVPDAAPVRGLVQRRGEGTLYGTLCVAAWKLPAARGDRPRGVSPAPAWLDGRSLR